jgi:O-antigen/teichoic acid export membrane protein
MSITKNSTILFSTQIVGLITGIFTSIVVSRTLGPSLRGVYFIATTVSFLIVSLGNLGLDFTNTYMLAKGKYSLGEVNSNSIWASVGIWLMVLVVYLLTHSYLHSNILKGVEQSYMLFVVVCLTPLSLYTHLWGGMMVGLNRISLLSVFGITSGIIGAISSFLVLVVFKWGIWGLLIQSAILGVIFVLVRLYFIAKIDKLTLSFNPRLLKEALHFGFRGQIGNVAGHILTRADIFIVNYFSGVTGVGYYSLSASLAQKIYLVANPIMTASNPRITGAPREESERLTAQVTRHIIFLVAGIIILLWIFAPWVIPFAYGTEFSPAVVPFRILSLGVLPEIVALIMAVYITGQLGKPQIGSAIAWLDLILFIPLGIFFTARYGFVGAALALSLTYLFDCIIFLLLFIKKSGQRIDNILFIKTNDLQVYFNLFSSAWNKSRTFLRG